VVYTMHCLFKRLFLWVFDLSNLSCVSVSYVVRSAYTCCQYVRLQVHRIDVPNITHVCIFITTLLYTLH
jgi:hypothetical protein